MSAMQVLPCRIVSAKVPIWKEMGETWIKWDWAFWELFFYDELQLIYFHESMMPGSSQKPWMGDCWEKGKGWGLVGGRRKAEQHQFDKWSHRVLTWYTCVWAPTPRTSGEGCVCLYCRISSPRRKQFSPPALPLVPFLWNPLQDLSFPDYLPVEKSIPTSGLNTVAGNINCKWAILFMLTPSFL